MTRITGISSLFGVRFLQNILAAPPTPLFGLFTWGRGSYGRLGQNNTLSGTQSISSPVQVGTLTDWSTVSVSPIGSSGALKTNGTIWAWGRNSVGQLGIGDTTDRSSPVQIGTGTNWSDMEIGYTSLALKTDGTLWAWGRNNDGSLGVGNTSPNSSPVQVGSDTDWAKISANSHDRTNFPFQISCAIKSNGTLWSWGNNIVGQLGHGDSTNRSVPVKVGTDTDWADIDGNGLQTVARKTNNTLWSWGYNIFGVLGINASGNKNSPVQIGTSTDWASVRCSTSMFSTPGPHMVAIKTNGTLWAWGYNNFGQLGQGNTTTRSSPVQVGADTDWDWVVAGDRNTIAAKTNGTLWGWGLDNYKVFLKPGPTSGLTVYSSPVQIGTSTSWSGLGNKKIAIDQHIMALVAQ